MADIRDLLREIQFCYGSVEVFCDRLRAATEEPTLELPAVTLLVTPGRHRRTD